MSIPPTILEVHTLCFGKPLMSGKMRTRPIADSRISYFRCTHVALLRRAKITTDASGILY